MKKVFAIGIIIICGIIYYCSNNPEIIERYTDYREKKSFLGSDKVGFGGLYGMCYLPEYRIPFNYIVMPAKKSSRKDIDLYILCDSYLFFPAKQNLFYGVDSLTKVKWFEVGDYKTVPSLRKNKHNVLVFEMTERYVRSICVSYWGMINLLKIDSSASHAKKQVQNNNPEPEDLSSFLKKNFFNPNINSNLELNLFDYRLFRPLKELKAEFNYKVFNRVNNDVFVDNTNKFLYYMPTVSGEQKMNSFFPLDSSEIPTISATLNKVYDYYKSNGFEEVYLSIIPNPVSVINPNLGNYNQLIPKINSLDTLRMKVIDIYSIYKKDPERYFSRSDSHWNSEGLQTWINEFNKILEAQHSH